MVGLMATSKRVYTRGDLPACCSQCPIPVLGPCRPTPPQETLTPAGGFGSVSRGVTTLFLWVLVCTWFCCALQDWSLCFPQSCGSLVIKSCWPSRSDSLGIPSPFGPQAGARVAAPGCGFSRGTPARSVSLSWGAREVGSPCEWRGGARHFYRVMVGESGLATC